MLWRQRFGSSEKGSLPLALLVAILVGGLIVVLVARTISSQGQVSFDETYHGALPGADAAIQLSKFRLNNGDLLPHEDGTMKAPAEFEVGESTSELSGEVDGRIFTWTMTLRDEGWEVDATSTDPRTGVERRVLAILGEQPLVDVAAFAETLLLFRGANRADSYNSRDGQEAWCTGWGDVASNGDVEFTGGAAGPTPRCPNPTGRTLDRVRLYDWDDNPGDVTNEEVRPGGSRCDNDSNHANCIEVNEDFPVPAIYPQYLDLATDEAVAFIKDALDKCKEDGPLEEFRATDHAGPLEPAVNAADAINAGDFALEGGHYCYDRAAFDRDIGWSVDASPSNPVIMFVERDVVLASSSGPPPVDVGCVGCQRGPDTNEDYPKAGSLLIFVLEGDVALRNHSQFAGVMYAPQATCRGENSNAQADIYGSIICDNIGNAGGWRFHYDEALADLSSGEYILTQWREAPRN